jgi:hypothetical protein
MKLEIILLSPFSLKENFTSCVPFIADDITRDKLAKLGKTIDGIVIVNNTTVKFRFSPIGIDGYIGHNVDDDIRRVLKCLIPAYIVSLNLTHKS